MEKENFNNRKQFKFYRSYYDIAKEITNDKERADYLMAICEYQFTGLEPELTGMTKFAFLSQKHSLEKQVVGYNFATNNKETPNTDPKGVSIPIPHEHTHIAINNNKEIIDNKEYIIINEENNNTASPFSFFNSLINYGFDKNLVSDWLKVRKTKKATNTETSFNSFIKEIEKRNCNINETLEFIIIKNWSGFKWSWYDAEKEKEKSFAKKEKETEKIVIGRQTMSTVQQNMDMSGVVNPWLKNE